MSLGAELADSKNPAEEFNLKFNHISNDVLQLFTDGSKISGKKFSGFAVVSNDCSIIKMFRASGGISIFAAEALAISEALNIFRSSGLTKLIIFSDSRSVLSALLGIDLLGRNNPHIIRLKDELRAMENEGSEVSVIWIPAHKGIVGNETADFYAKKAICEGTDTRFALFPADFKPFWKGSLYSEAANALADLAVDKGRFYFHNFYTPSRRLWFDYFDLNRKQIVSLCRLRSGHTSLRENLFRFNIMDNPNCPVCNVPESPDHVVWQCSRFSEQRIKLIRGGRKAFGTLPWPVCSILVSSNTEGLMLLAKFIDSIDILI